MADGGVRELERKFAAGDVSLATYLNKRQQAGCEASRRLLLMDEDLQRAGYNLWQFLEGLDEVGELGLPWIPPRCRGISMPFEVPGYETIEGLRVARQARVWLQGGNAGLCIEERVDSSLSEITSLGPFAGFREIGMGYWPQSLKQRLLDTIRGSEYFPQTASTEWVVHYYRHSLDYFSR